MKQNNLQHFSLQNWKVLGSPDWFWIFLNSKLFLLRLVIVLAAVWCLMSSMRYEGIWLNNVHYNIFISEYNDFPRCFLLEKVNLLRSTVRWNNEKVINWIKLEAGWQIQYCLFHQHNFMGAELSYFLSFHFYIPVNRIIIARPAQLRMETFCFSISNLSAWR